MKTMRTFTIIHNNSTGINLMNLHLLLLDPVNHLNQTTMAKTYKILSTEFSSIVLKDGTIAPLLILRGNY